MGHDRYDFGDLNPAVHPQTGRSLDPESFSGTGNLAEAAKRVNTPSFLDKLGFPLKGIVLRSEGEVAGGSWWQRLLPFGVGAPQLWQCRVRIPEIHSHLPIPETYGPEGQNSVMLMYPLFVAKDEDVTPPVEGEICYVDFADRKRLEDPIYLGMASSKPRGGGGSVGLEDSGVASVANQNESSLAATAPAGDPLGGFEGESSLEGMSVEPAQAPSVFIDIDNIQIRPGAREESLPPDPSLPPTTYLFPVKNGIITSTFGPRVDPVTRKRHAAHGGVDIVCPSGRCVGTPIYACADGVVSFVFRDGVGAGKASGNAVGIRHDDGFSSSYSHLSRVLVRSGRVKRGDIIGYMGSTGRSTGPHLHWRVNDKSGKKIDGLKTLVGAFKFAHGDPLRGTSRRGGSSTNYPR